MSVNIEKNNYYQEIKTNFNSSDFILNNTSLKHGFEKFSNKLTEQYPNILFQNYIYINIWSIICKPCLDEIPYIDNLPSKFNKDLTCIMITSHSQKAVNNFISLKGVKMNNFIFLNEMIDFISGIYNAIEKKNQSWPLHVVMDKRGNCLAYIFGSIHDDFSSAPLINFINSLE
jgi:hypothetical protein